MYNYNEMVDFLNKKISQNTPLNIIKESFYDKFDDKMSYKSDCIFILRNYLNITGMKDCSWCVQNTLKYYCQHNNRISNNYCNTYRPYFSNNFQIINSIFNTREEIDSFFNINMNKDKFESSYNYELYYLLFHRLLNSDSLFYNFKNKNIIPIRVSGSRFTPNVDKQLIIVYNFKKFYELGLLSLSSVDNYKSIDTETLIDFCNDNPTMIELGLLTY